MSLRHLAFAALALTLAACSSSAPISRPGAAFQANNARAVLPKPPVRQHPSPNQNERPAGAGISAIVLHHTAMAENADDVARFFARPNAKVSSHYVVDRTGYIVQPVDDNLRSWHAGNSQLNGKPDVNSFSIGIEICNLGDSVEPYSDAQYDGLIRLVGYLVTRYQVPVANIVRHRDIAVPAGRKIDTSNNFSVQRVLDGVRALQNGTYVSPPPSAQTPAPNVSSFKEVSVQVGQTHMRDLADIYLNNAERWVEIQALNPQLSPELQPGTRVKLPTTLAFYAHEH
ncbi:MAG: N-acetylmuramoyl-L-alanine amidase [Candidatus Sericytochromatia bacterium]